jgi:RNase P protein component
VKKEYLIGFFVDKKYARENTEESLMKRAVLEHLRTISPTQLAQQAQVVAIAVWRTKIFSAAM